MTEDERREIRTAVAAEVDTDPAVIAVRQFVSEYGAILENSPPPNGLGIFHFIDSKWISEDITDATSRTLRIGEWTIMGFRLSDYDEDYRNMSVSMSNFVIFSYFSDPVRMRFRAHKYKVESISVSDGACGYSGNTSTTMPFGSIDVAHCGVDRKDSTIILQPQRIRFKAIVEESTVGPSSATVTYQGDSRKIADVKADECRLYPEVLDLFAFDFFRQLVGMY